MLHERKLKARTTDAVEQVTPVEPHMVFLPVELDPFFIVGDLRVL